VEDLTGREMLVLGEAWPLLRPLAARRRFSEQRLPLLVRSEEIEHCTAVEPLEVAPDRLSDLVERRVRFEETYAAEIKVMSEQKIPPAVHDALRDNHMPQFTLRNIGRAERSVEPDEPLRFDHSRTTQREGWSDLEVARQTRVPRPELAEVWSTAFVARVRASFRRLLLEDPWELRYGAEVKANHPGLQHSFIIDGTHPDDMPGADWGPALIPLPAAWQSGPPGDERMERPVLPEDMLAALRKG
jgi:hypothetical protein